MAKTRTSGIILKSDGSRTINKQWQGQRIFIRLGKVSQEEAEAQLTQELSRIDRASGLQWKTKQTRFCDVPVFAYCAGRYLAESTEKRSVETLAYHVELLLPFIGHLPITLIHDGTLETFKAARRECGVSPTTINRSLEVVRTVLQRAARAWRTDDGYPLLPQLPPLIGMEKENPRKPRPLAWDEQDKLMPHLSEHLRPMIVFAINTGLRDNNVCGLRWEWEVAVPEAGRSVFLIPASEFKTTYNHVAILNDIAWEVIEGQRGKSDCWVFPYRGKRIETINNSSYQRARSTAGLKDLRVHDLRHTFATRLRLAGVSQEDRNSLMGHSKASMPELYASADIGRLIELANRITSRSGTLTVIRVAANTG